ncbi:MAG: PDZ domain-containing protein [Erysipelotrichaceae bacterium]|nr:PDZ domain-containing protein [Erysipelotrichaceae bacterium]
MKKLGILLFVILIFYCAFLTFQISELKKGNNAGEQDSVTYVNKTVTGFSTDLTKIIENTGAQVVHVDAFHSSSTASLSGVIVSEDQEKTVIVTNAKDIENALSISVTFDNGESVTGTLEGVDSLTDLAVISTHPSFSSTPVTVADSSVLSLGEWVIAVGSDIRTDFLPSVSVGVISGKDRPYSFTSFVQMHDPLNVHIADLDIGQGTAGGAVVNMQGELIGISSSVLSENGQCVIIPAEEVVEVVRLILEKQEVQRPVLGMTAKVISEMTAYQKSQLAIQLDQIEGLYVTSVERGGPCDLSGIEQGDIVLEMNGNKLSDLNTLRTQLYAHVPSDQIELTILRGTNQMKVMVTLQ